MRDAFGSTFMFRIIIIFIVMYVTFATIAVSYAKTFRLKNRVVDIIEQSQLNYGDLGTNAFLASDVVNDVDAFLAKHNYSYMDKVRRECENQSDGESGIGHVTKNGACILPVEYQGGHYYYRVTLYMIISIPLINYDAVIPVSGETEDFS